MKIQAILFFLLAGVVLSGCYKDKGNYNYKKLTRIEVSDFSNVESVTIGDTVRVVPRFVYSTNDTVMNLKYEWTFAGKVISTERNLEYVTDTVAKGNCILVVEDVDNEVFFTKDFYLTVGYKYEKQGFLVLAEKNGSSSLSFLTQGYTSGVGMTFNVVSDIYELENKEKLGGTPFKIHEHFCKDGDTKSQILVLQDGGLGLVDVNGLTFKKEVTGNQIFVGGWPAGLRVVNTMFMQWVDLLQDDRGRLYSRVKSTNQLFHSEYFLPDPLKYEGEVIEDAEVILGVFADPKLCLIYDGKNNRFLALMDFNDEEGNNVVGLIRTLKAEKHPAEYAPLENMGDYRPVYTGYLRGLANNSSGIAYFSILEKGGKFYHQEFIIEREYTSSEIGVDTLTQVEVPGLAGVVNENSVIYALPYLDNGHYVFIANGNQLYLYDAETPENGVKLYMTFESDITAMDGEFFRSNYLGVGLENGRVFVLTMINAKNLQTDEEKIWWQSPTGVDLGHIKSIRYRVMSGNSWNP